MLSSLLKNLAKARDLSEKVAFLNTDRKVKKAVKDPYFSQVLEALTLPREYILKQLISLGQSKVIFSSSTRKKLTQEKLEKFLDELWEIDLFYQEIGGLAGYHAKILSCLHSSKEEEKENSLYHPPSFIDISKEETRVRKAILWGIEHLPELCELYPLGGAADRLHLQDPDTKAELPAARLFFSGKTLLEWLIFDVQAREYLYYKLHGKELITPIAMMTSLEKNNYEHILAICEKNRWFGRPKESFRIFLQPLVPTITHLGKWCMKEPLQPLLKPGGHGAIWKLAKDFGILQWFQKRDRRKMLVRQINNPIAGVDYGLLAFTGIGSREDQYFGFASCPRECGSAEGINVLVEKEGQEGFSYTLSNIEYCDFARYGIDDEPREKGDPYSRFSSNTNILFADVKAVEKAVEKRPFPGILINLKEVKFRSGKRWKEKKVARLESTMQNIADEFVEARQKKLPEDKRELKKTFITYNLRHKTISTAKKVYLPGKSSLETPERCFYDLFLNAYALLKNCEMEVPALLSFEEYLEKGPSFFFTYHPALGPLYSVIQQKIKGGKIHPQSELICDIAELSLENLDLQGSLLIQAKDATGHRGKDGLLHPSDQGGKCFFRNVRIENIGIDQTKPQIPWKGEPARRESLSIILHGNAEIYAENITLKGNHKFEIFSGEQVRLVEKEGEIHAEKRKISSPSWHWKYEVMKDFRIQLERILH